MEFSPRPDGTVLLPIASAARLDPRAQRNARRLDLLEPTNQVLPAARALYQWCADRDRDYKATYPGDDIPTGSSAPGDQSG